jgi:predicted metal-dependent phosphoesterase TrpH
VHLLALHITDPDALAASLELFQRERLDRARAMVDRLAALGVPVAYSEVLREAAGGAVGRPHVARALVAAGHVADQREAFDRFLANGKPAYVPKPRLAASDAIDLAHSAGALAVWAHPARIGTRDRVARLAAHGLDGIEVLHPSHAPHEVEKFARFADEFALVRSGGSDWHGASEGFRTLGCMHVPAEWLARQDERRAARAA